MVRTRVKVNRLALVACALVCAFGISLTGCAEHQTSEAVSSVSPSPTRHPTVVKTAAATIATPLAALVIGQCISDSEDSMQPKVGSTTVLPCSQAHAGEVYATPQLSGTTYPGDETVSSAASDDCSSAFTAYTGAGVQASHLDFVVDIPTSDQWESGDHSALCVIFSPQGNLIGSAKSIGTQEPRLAG